MSALDDAIAQIDALLQRLQTDPGTSAAHPSAAPVQPASQPIASGISKTPPQSVAASPAPATKNASIPSATAAAPAVSGAADGRPQQGAQKKVKPAKAPKAPPPEPTTADLFNKAHLQVGRVLSVEELETSDKLYKVRVQVMNGGEPEERQIMAGLRKHIARSELEGSHVVVILNLKAARLAGEASEGMILAGVHTDPAVEHGEFVKPVQPPAGSEAGDRVLLEGATASTDFPKVLKSDAWKKMAALLRVLGGRATFDGKPLVTAKGVLAVPGEMPDGAHVS